MKIAYLCESSADRTAIQILVDALLGETTTPFAVPFEASGWTTLMTNLHPAILHLHYNTDADGLAVVLDSDSTSPHSIEHDSSPERYRDCRLCTAITTARDTLRTLKPRAMPPLRMAFGLAVPSIEAWLQCGHDPEVTEARWLIARNENKYPYNTRRLKEAVYGTDRPGLPLETKRMVEEATRLAGNIAKLESAFPAGFGSFAHQVRAWKVAVSPKPST